MDSVDGNRKVDAQEFFVSLNEFGVKVTKAEADVFISYLYFIQALMMHFDTDGDGHINFDEFLVGVRVSYNLY